MNIYTWWQTPPPPSTHTCMFDMYIYSESDTSTNLRSTSLCLSLCLSVSAFLPAWLPVCLSVCPSLSLSSFMHKAYGTEAWNWQTEDRPVTVCHCMTCRQQWMCFCCALAAYRCCGPLTFNECAGLYTCILISPDMHRCLCQHCGCTRQRRCCIWCGVVC